MSLAKVNAESSSPLLLDKVAVRLSTASRRALGVSGCAVYLLLCVTTRRIYVGSTRNIGNRLANYRYKARHGVTDTVIGRALVKHGVEAFMIVILEHVLDGEQLRDREQAWIDMLQPFGERGYNTARVAHTTTWKPADPEAYREAKRQVALRYAQATRERCSRPVYQIDPTTLQIVAEYPSINAASDAVQANVGGVCRGDPHAITAGGYYWCFKDVYNPQSFRPARRRSNGAAAILKPVLQLDDNGQTIHVWDSCTDAARALGTSPTMVSNACHTGYRHKGFRWRLVTDEGMIAEVRTRRAQAQCH